jgi:hypothetical protein
MRIHVKIHAYTSICICPCGCDLAAACDMHQDRPLLILRMASTASRQASSKALRALAADTPVALIMHLPSTPPQIMHRVSLARRRAEEDKEVGRGGGGGTARHAKHV